MSDLREVIAELKKLNEAVEEIRLRIVDLGTAADTTNILLQKLTK